MKKTLLALMLAGFASTSAADSWLYAGGNFGQATLGDYDSTSTYSLHVGTGILPIIGLEAGYVNHGVSEDNSLSQVVEIDSSSLYFAMKPSIDFGPLHVYGKLGFHSYSLDAAEALVTDSFEDGFDIMYGVGAEYFIMSMFSVGAGYQNYSLDNGDIESFTINATFHFL
jgi:hypothetical protein